MKIFLVGLPASGKTTLGMELSKALGIAFIDLDREVEREEGMPIHKIFAEQSEDKFRKTENRILKIWCQAPGDYVMSTGGGAPSFFDNMEMMNRAGTSVFLDVTPPELARRMLSSDISLRPLFAGTPPEGIEKKLGEMRALRLPFYVKAHFTVSGPAIGLKEILEKVKRENRK